MAHQRWVTAWVSEDSLMVRPLQPKYAQHLVALETHCHNHFTTQLLDTILAYDSLLLIFALPVLDHANLLAVLESILIPTNTVITHKNDGQLHRLPICYDPEYALDLAEISAHTGLSPECLINAHQNNEYRVLAMGFSPGFAYCGLLPPRLIMPRKTHPRIQVPAGSLAIANNQTAIYPQASPGGWQILGRCPVSLFDATQPIAKASLLKTGDRVCFYGIDRVEFERWEKTT